MGTDNNYEYKDLTKTIIGACFEVSNELGVGFLESVYEKALCIVLNEKGLKIEAQLINYLKASRKHIGLLVNFSKPKLEWKRFAY